jgi:phage terminase Nu1 subunit (DNA packaging protein)
MAAVTKKWLAKRARVSLRRVNQMIRAGLPVRADGKIDEVAGLAWIKANVRKRGGDTAASRGKPKIGAVIRDNEVDEGALSDFAERLLHGDYASTTEALRIKENALALKHLLDAKKEAGELVEMSVAEGVLAEAAQTARDALMNLPSRIGPLLAADLGVESGKVVEALTGYIHRHMLEMSDHELGKIGHAAATAEG